MERFNKLEEDIKILEDYLDKQDRKYVSEYRLMILQAIENLIARYKEVKERECIYKSTSSCVKGLSSETLNKLNDYIPKSKVKEKIEELKNELKEKNWGERTLLGFRNRIQVLQELLED